MLRSMRWQKKDMNWMNNENYGCLQLLLRVLWWSDRIQSDRGPSFTRYIRVDEFKDSQEEIDREEEDENWVHVLLPSSANFYSCQNLWVRSSCWMRKLFSIQTTCCIFSSHLAVTFVWVTTSQQRRVQREVSTPPQNPYLSSVEPVNPSVFLAQARAILGLRTQPDKLRM